MSLENWTLKFVQEEMPKLQDSNTIGCDVHLISYIKSVFEVSIVSTNK